MKGADLLHIVDYSAHWDKNGSLEVQYSDGDGKLQDETFRVQTPYKEQPNPAKQ